MELKRRKFQGVLNILSFNRHFYYYGGLVLLLIIGSSLLVEWPSWIFIVVIAGFLYGLLMPLIVSAYVYDYSGYYDFDWLRELDLPDTPRSFNLNINAGFDETSYILESILPQSTLQVFDFYDESRHTEPAIIRARKVSLVFPDTRTIDSQNIPVSDATVDHVFLLSAAHEIRKADERIAFLRECRRVCKSEGKVIMVEHLRDWPNFLAFSIGFTHFYSAATWRESFQKAGFETIQERKFTPFMSIFVCS